MTDILRAGPPRTGISDLTHSDTSATPLPTRLSTDAPPTVTPTPVREAEAARRARSNISVLIPTFNEEVNLPHALKSVVGWADKVWVVDSESTDRTREIAKSMGAEVVVQPWLGYARQKNWALDNLPWQSEWLFILDADESITPELRDEMLAISKRDPAQVAEGGFYVNRLPHFMGRPIRHCGFYPSYNLRFFKRGKARYEDREVHEHMVVDGETTRLNQIMLHEDRRGLEHWIAKHNRYSTLEAREIVKEQLRVSSKRASRLERGIAFRRWLKLHVLPYLPLSGLFRFFYMYIFRLGFLDGATGFRFCLLLAVYDYFITLKLAELRLAGAHKNPEILTPQAAGLAKKEGTVSTVSGEENPDASRVGAAPILAQTAVPPPPPTASTPSRVELESLPASVADLVSKNGAVPAVAPAPSSSPTSPVRPTVRPEIAPPAAHTLEPRHPEADALRDELGYKRNPPFGVWPAVGSVPVSVLIPVKNEQRNIAECLRRVQWATEIVVADSQSADKTIPMAQALGADVYQFYYSTSGWPKKKNWALETVPWKNKWVLILDADEYMTPELADEVRRVVSGEWKPWKDNSAGCGDGYWLNRRFMFIGRWLKGCGFYPSYNVRLFKHDVGRYERIGTLGDTGSGDNEVHEHVVLSTGEAGYLQHDFLHFAYPDLSVWVEKHNRYTTWEAFAMEAKDEGAIKPSLFGGPIERRRWLKRFARKLPFRPSLRFVYSYVFQRGFLDGYAGFVMCRLLAWYEFMSIAKHREMKVLRETPYLSQPAVTKGLLPQQGPAMAKPPGGQGTAGGGR
jgi:glycosyltransferase involved in cell wall biosynthesis